MEVLDATLSVQVDGEWRAVGEITKYAPPIHSPVGLLKACEPQPLVWLSPRRGVSKYGNPRQYLKRKKGRS